MFRGWAEVWLTRDFWGGCFEMCSEMDCRRGGMDARLGEFYVDGRYVIIPAISEAKKELFFRANFQATISTIRTSNGHSSEGISIISREIIFY